MSIVETELMRLTRVEHETHARFLRLQIGMTDAGVVNSANVIWLAAVADLRAYTDRSAG